MDSTPEFPAAFNLLICYYALGDPDLMRRGFQRLLQVPLPVHEDDEDDEEEHGDGHGDTSTGAGATGDDVGPEDGGRRRGADSLNISRDVLKDELAARQKAALGYVTTAAKLIAPVAMTSVGQGARGGGRGKGDDGLGGTPAAATDWEAGYDWVIEQLKVDHAAAASELQVCKALT